MSRLLPALMMALFLITGTAAAQQVQVSGSSGDGIDSLRFDWPGRVGYEAQRFGSTLALAFDRTVTADFGAVSEGVGTRVAGVVPDTDGRTVLIELSGDPRFRSRREGNSVVLDFFDRAAPLPPPPLPASLPASQPPPQSGEVPLLEVRTGAHDGYYRFVFDWPDRVPYSVAGQAGRAVIRFGRPARIDVPEVRRRIPARFGGFSSAPADGGLDVTIPLQEGAEARHFTIGTRVVVDITTGGGAAPGGTAATRPLPRAATAAAGASASPAPVLRPGGAQPSPAVSPDAAARQFGIGRPLSPTPLSRPAARSSPASPPAATPPAATSPAATSRGAPPAPATPPVQAGREPEAFGTAARLGEVDLARVLRGDGSLVERLRAGDTGRIEGPSVPVTTSRENGIVSVRFGWTEAVPAAVFGRGGHVWVVFGAPARFEIGRAGDSLQVLGDKAQIAVEGGSAVRIPTVEGVGPRVWRDDTAWIVDFRPQLSGPDVALPVETQLVSAQGPRVFVPMESHGATVIARDPALGDRVFVVPLRALGRGIEGMRRFAEFNLLNTAQGVVVQPFADDIVMRALPDGIAVTRRGGLAVSRQVRQSADDRVAQRLDGLPPGLPPGRIFDFANWRKGGADRFLPEKQAIQQRVSEATSIARSGPRLDLAHFYFAHGLAAETVGLMRAISDKDEDLARRPDVRALSGAAQFMLGRFGEAEDYLMDQGLNGLSEIELWRGATKAAQERWPEAVEHFSRAGAIPGGYPRNMATRVALLAAEAAIRAGDLRGAGAFLDVIAEGQPTPGERARLNFLRGRVLYASGDTDGALDFWRPLAEGADRWARVRSARAVTEHELRNGTLDRPEAIETLESLRYTWRGDQVEFDLLRELGRLYLEEGMSVQGLGALREAVTFFPENAYAEQVAGEMTDAFARILTDGDAVGMTPVQALSLYDEFRELTPVGARGDEIIQRLADRLVQIDLLDRAALLLERQVRFRLEGGDKARVGARLALIRLLDRKPEEALEALDGSVAPGLDAELALERKRLRARAGFELGDAAGALRLLAGDNSRDADLLRADIHWRTQDWGAAAEVFRRLVGRAGRDGRRIDERAATLILNWAVALSLSNNQEGLGGVRQTYTRQMDDTPFREAFRLITNRTEGEPEDFSTLAGRFGEIGRFQAFLSSYRDRLRDRPLSDTN